MEPKDNKGGKKQPLKLRYPLIGVSMPLCVVIGFLLGRFLDRQLQSGPIGLIVCTLLGIAAGYVQLFRLNKRD